MMDRRCTEKFINNEIEAGRQIENRSKAEIMMFKVGSYQKAINAEKLRLLKQEAHSNQATIQLEWE